MKDVFCATLCAVLLSAAAAVTARADERILEFHSDISVDADASMLVNETIRVRAEGSRIRHGIYRDFPTDYRDRFNNQVHVAFRPFELTRDGVAEPYHTEGQGNGVRVYFGSKSTELAPGEYTYVLSYKTTRQLGFFDDHDELYWNVTGNGWDFAIDQASADVSLPDAIPADQVHVEGYTGRQGAKGRAYRASADATSHATFRTTQGLAPNEGLTIVVAFPKGSVAAPTSGDRAQWFLRDNAAVLVGGIGLLLVWAYYLWQWLRVGRDPKPGVIIPQYEPPEGFSPGALRYMERMKYDDRCFAADVVDLAVRGELTIEQWDTTFSLQRTTQARGTMPGSETILLDSALGTSEKLELKQDEHVRIAGARDAHKAELVRLNSGRYFNTNSVLVIPGAALCVVSLLIALFSSHSVPVVAGAGFMLVWLSGWSVGVVVLLRSVRNAWRQPAGVATSAAALFLTLFALPFVAGELVGIGAFFLIAGVGFGLVVVSLIATNIAFFEWLKAPTVEGRKLLDHIAGMRLYLGVAERDDLARQKAPPMTVEEFQKFLPYALALDVEKTWADRFAAAVGPAAAAAAVGALAWYQGSGGLSDLSSLSSGLGSSLSGAISSSSSAPGSSSGSGGGGSSGGSGGGGGGGGW